jgi:hypothetical protein
MMRPSGISRAYLLATAQAVIALCGIVTPPSLPAWNRSAAAGRVFSLDHLYHCCCYSLLPLLFDLSCCFGIAVFVCYIMAVDWATLRRAVESAQVGSPADYGSLNQDTEICRGRRAAE